MNYKGISILLVLLDIDLKIPFDMPHKLCGMLEGIRAGTKKQEIYLFPEVNGTQVFLKRKCSINCVNGMLEGCLSTCNTYTAHWICDNENFHGSPEYYYNQQRRADTRETGRQLLDVTSLWALALRQTIQC